MKRLFAAVPAALMFLLVAGAVQAQERPNYNYLELDYVYATADVDAVSLSDSANNNDWYFDEGAQFEASYALQDKWLFRGSYYTASGDFKSQRDIDFSSGLIGVGILLPTDDAIGIDASIEYRTDELEFDGDDDDIDGLGASFGVRANITEKSELGMRFGFYLGDFDESIDIKLFYAWNFLEHWGVTAGYQYTDVGLDGTEKEGYELDKWFVGGRFYF